MNVRHSPNTVFKVSSSRVPIYMRRPFKWSFCSTLYDKKHASISYRLLHSEYRSIKFMLLFRFETDSATLQFLGYIWLFLVLICPVGRLLREEPEGMPCICDNRSIYNKVWIVSLNVRLSRVFWTLCDAAWFNGSGSEKVTVRQSCFLCRLNVFWHFSWLSGLSWLVAYTKATIFCQGEKIG